MGRVGLALVWHEVLERARDRWVLVISLLFALLASGVSLYGRSAGENAAMLTGPSLVTLIGLLVPLVALVLGHDAIVGERERNTLGLLLSLPVTKMEVVVAKLLGRMLALTAAISLGLGAALVLAGDDASVLWTLFPPTIVLGAVFLALGVLISALVTRQVTAAALVVSVWFVLVFFYDLGLLGLLVVTDGQISQQLVVDLVFANPAGLFRVSMMERFAGPEVLEGLEMAARIPSAFTRACIWIAWIVIPIGISGVSLSLRKVNR